MNPLYIYQLFHYVLQTKWSYKDGIVAILHIQNSIILIQTTEDKIVSW